MSYNTDWEDEVFNELSAAGRPDLAEKVMDMVQDYNATLRVYAKLRTETDELLDAISAVANK